MLGPHSSPRNSTSLTLYTDCLELYWLPCALLTIYALLTALLLLVTPLSPCRSAAIRFPLGCLTLLWRPAPPTFSVLFCLFDAILAFRRPPDNSMSSLLFGVLMATRLPNGYFSLLTLENQNSHSPYSGLSGLLGALYTGS